jgi:hypothetical protein
MSNEKKKSIDTIGNRNRDLPAYSAEPQPTAPPRAPNVQVFPYNIMDVRKGTGSSDDLVASFFRSYQEDLSSTKTGKPDFSEKVITIHQSTQCHITEENSISNRY